MSRGKHYKFSDDGITDEIVEVAAPERLLHPRGPAQEEGQAARARAPSGPTTGCARTTTSTRCAPPWATGAGATIRASRARRAACLSTGSAATATAGCSSARSRPPRRRSSSPSTRPSWASRYLLNRLREANEAANPGLDASRLQDGHRQRQDRRHGHAHRLARAEQDRGTAGRPLQRLVSHRDAGHHHPRPSARAAAQRCRQLLPQARRRARRAHGAAQPRQDRDHQLPRLLAARERQGRHS